MSTIKLLRNLSRLSLLILAFLPIVMQQVTAITPDTQACIQAGRSCVWNASPPTCGSGSATVTDSSGNTTCCTTSSSATGSGTLPSYIPDPYNTAFTEGANAHDVSPALVAAIFSEEHNIGNTSGNSGVPATISTSTLQSDWSSFLSGQPDPNSGWGGSSAGAEGPFQFLVSTFTGLGYNASDINNLDIAADAAAKYLASDGGKIGNPEQPIGGNSLANAIFAYNHATWYVTAVLSYYSVYSAGGSSTGTTTASTPTTPASPSSCCPPTGSPSPTSTGGVTTTSASGKPSFVDLSGPPTDGTDMGHGKLSEINTLIIHYTEGNTEGAALKQFFTNEGLGYGVQFNIGLTGTVYQYFPLDAMQETWHVGDDNDHSIGIEITGMDGESLLNDQPQFNSVVSTVKYLCSYYNIPCSNPIGEITGDIVDNAMPNKNQGLLGHSEATNSICGELCKHSDPDSKIVGDQLYNITTGKLWTDADRSNSSIHAYMMKLRTALGYNPTPGQSGSTASGPTTGSSGSGTGTPPTCAGTATPAGSGTDGSGTATDPVGDGPNKALAVTALNYATATHPQYKYQEPGMGHGSTAELNQFNQNGGYIDCSGFVRFVIWEAYGFDVGSTTAQDYINNPYFEKITDPSQVAAGDLGVIDTSTTQHVDFITDNEGNGMLHEFGAHDPQQNISGGDVSASNYTYFLRYTGPVGSGE